MRAAALLAAVCLTAAATAHAADWRRVTDAAAGYSIAVPSGWHVVPRSLPQLQARIRQEVKAKHTALATQFAEVAAARRAAHTTYRFQAFAWPPPKGAVVPDVTVKTDRLTKGTTSAALPAIARQIAKSLSRSAGAKVAAPVRRTLPAGRAVLVSGSLRLSKAVRSRFALYLLVHGRTLYSLTFRGPRTAAEQRIAAGFRVGR